MNSQDTTIYVGTYLLYRPMQKRKPAQIKSEVKEKVFEKKNIDNIFQLFQTNHFQFSWLMAI